MKVTIEANGNKFEFRMARPDKTAIESICRIIRTQTPDKVAAAKKPAKKKSQKPSAWRVYLEDIGPSKINVIKTARERIRSQTTGQILGLKEAKELVETPDALLLKRAPTKQAEIIQKAFEAAGAKLRLEGVK
jgi:ribosomal protein L7/L12